MIATICGETVPIPSCVVAMASTDPFSGNSLTDIPEDVKKHPSGYGSGRMTMKELAISIGAGFNSDLAGAGGSGEQGQGNEGDGDDKKDTGAGGDGGDDPDEPSDNGSESDHQEEEEEEESEEGEEDESEKSEAEPEQPVAKEEPKDTGIVVKGVSQTFKHQNLITVNFVFSANGETYNVRCFHRVNFSGCRDAFFAQCPVKVADRKKFRFHFNDIEIDKGSKTLMTLGITDGAIVRVSVVGVGGAVKGIRKTIQKLKVVSATTGIDRPIYASSFNGASTICASTTFDVKVGLEELPVPKLVELRDFLKSDKSNANVKAKSIYQFLPLGWNLEHTKVKVEYAIEKLSALVEADLKARYWDEETDKFDIDKMRELITSIIGVKEYVIAKSQPAQPPQPKAGAVANDANMEG